MRHPPAERLRAYVRAEADVTSRLLVEAHLSLCPDCSAHVAESQRVGGHLPDATLHDELDLPPFDRVWTGVKQATRTRQRLRTPALPPALLATLLPTLPPPCRWRRVAVWPAVKVTLLIRDAETGSALYLCHLARGSTFPRHRHLGREENVILTGGYRNGDVHVHAGDWVIGAPGTEESPRAEHEECWCLSRVEPPGTRFAGWRRWIAPFFS